MWCESWCEIYVECQIYVEIVTNSLPGAIPAQVSLEDAFQNSEGGVVQMVGAPMASWGEEAARLARGRISCDLHQL